jgi:hypothetical protein
LGVRKNSFDVIEQAAPVHETMPYFVAHFPTDSCFGCKQEIQAFPNGPFYTVFCWNNGKISPSGRNFVKGHCEAVARCVRSGFSEVAQGGFVGMGTFRPEVCHCQGLLQIPRTGEYLFEDGPESSLL